MKLIMVTPRVGIRNTLFAFIPSWVTHLANYVEHLWIVTPRMEQVPLPDNVTVYEVGRDYSRGENILHAVHNFHQAMWEITHNHRVDGIFTHMYPKFAILSAPYAKSQRIPLVQWYTHTSVNWQLRLAGLLADRIVTASADSCRLKSKKVIIIGHGIDTNLFYPPDQNIIRLSDVWTLLSVGRLSSSKKYEVIFEALEILVYRKNYRNVHLFVIGEAPNPKKTDYVEYIQSEVKKRNLSTYVTFQGAVPHNEIIDYIHQADAFISASTTGLDKAVLEAMACGVIPILSLENFRSSLGIFASQLMYEPLDAPGLAHRIESLINLEETEFANLKKAMTNIVIQQHDVDKLMHKLINVFKGLRKDSISSHLYK